MEDEKMPPVAEETTATEMIAGESSPEATTETPAEETTATPEDRIAELEAANAELQAKVDRYIENDEKLKKILRMNPGLIKAIQMMYEGASWEEAVARNVDLSAIPVEGDPDYGKWSEQAKAREEDYNKSVDFDNQLAKNREISQQNLKEFAEENGMSDEQAMQFITDHVSPLLDMIATLNFTKEFLTMIHKAVNHESKVAEARDEGMIEGKNAKIEEEIMTPPPAGDGLPKGGNAMAAEKPQKKQSYIDYLKS